MKNYNSNNKTAKMDFRVTPEDKQKIIDDARHLGMTTSDYIASIMTKNTRRLAGFRKRKVTKVLVSTSNRIDSYIAELQNTGAETVETKQVITRLSEIYEEEDKIWHR